MSTHPTDIGAQVREARKIKGMSAAKLAELAHVAPNTISAIENGRSVRAGSLNAVLVALDIEPLADRQKREGYPADIELVRDLIGMYLIAMPETERPGVAYELTKFLMARAASSERARSGQ